MFHMDDVLILKCVKWYIEVRAGQVTSCRMQRGSRPMVGHQDITISRTAGNTRYNASFCIWCIKILINGTENSFFTQAASKNL